MCVIIIADKKNPPKSLLKKAERSNPDGAGIAWIEDGSVKWVKGKDLTSEKIKEIIKVRKIKLPYIIHYRIKTVGDSCDQLSHPFPLSAGKKNRKEGSDQEGVLFHNGHYDKWELDLKTTFIGFRENIPDEKMSDSRAMSLVASKSKLGLGYLRTISGQKIAVLTPKGIKRYGSNWAKVESITCSNDNFDFSRWSYSSCEIEDDITDKNYKVTKYDGITTYEKSKNKRRGSVIVEDVRKCKNSAGTSKKTDEFSPDINRLYDHDFVNSETCICDECYDEAKDLTFDHNFGCMCQSCEKIADRNLEIADQTVEEYEKNQKNADKKPEKNAVCRFLKLKKTHLEKLMENDQKLIDETIKENNREMVNDEIEKRKIEAQDEYNEMVLSAKKHDD